MTGLANVLALVLAGVVALALLAAVLAALFTWFVARKAEAILPPRGRFIDLPGARLHLREAGGGDGADDGAPPILMIHGLAGQSAHFGYALFGRLGQRFRLAAPDRPGCGYSPRAPGTLADLRSQSAAMAALIDRLGLARPLVVGHSLGGAVALALALDHPDKVAGLALLAPLTHIQDAPPRVFAGLTIASPLLRRLVAWTLATPLSVKHSAATLDQVFGPDPVPKDFATRGGGLLGLRPSAFLGASSDLQALPDCLPQQQALYPTLRVPLHILYGRDDRILDWRRNGQAMVDKVPGARLDLIDGGHMLPITHPDACAAFIEAAARACRPSGSRDAQSASR